MLLQLTSLLLRNSKLSLFLYIGASIIKLPAGNEYASISVINGLKIVIFKVTSIMDLTGYK